ncbi:lanthionine synthetase-like protein [Novosphingobium taihuense]|nr:lanthionine synthetase-like protein [Novosphingobium taihuense]
MVCVHEASNTSVSRRDLLHAGVATAGAGSLLTAIPHQAIAAGAASASPLTGQSFGPSNNYLEMAKSAADWILSSRSADEFGVFFPADPSNPKRLFMTSSSPESFYCGIAGMIVTFAELAQKTGEVRYREAAIAGAERLLKRWRAIADTPIPTIDMRWSMIFGVSGIGMALYKVGDMLSEQRFTAALQSIADRIVAAADHNNTKGTWTPFAGYIADSSTILFLLHAARILNRKDYLRTAEMAGDRLISLASQETDGTLAWKGPQNPVFPNLYYPGFELGTAGIAYTLASIHEESGDPRYLDAAKRGAQHLMNLAVGNGKAALIPYALPDHPDVFYLGFCHGAAGTARLFYKLHNLTGERLYLDWTSRLAEGILSAGAPELESRGMWNTVTQCCGVASHVTLFLGLWARYGNPEYLKVAQRAAATISSRSSNLDGKGAKWYMAWARVEPANVNAEAGYMIGASGIASALLHLHLANAGQYEVNLPWDNPFPTKKV